SLVVILAYQFFWLGPQMELQRQHQLAQRAAEQAQQQTPTAPGVTPPPVSGTASPAVPQQAEAILAGDTARVKLDSATVDGSIRLTGGRFDDLRFKMFRQDIDPKSPEIVFLTPQGAAEATYATMGW